MSKQWGHGYFKGIEAAKSHKGSLRGLWFHSRHDDGLGWQGQVVRELENGNYLVQLYEWMMGEPSVQKVVSPTQMIAWDFYANDSQMRIAADEYWSRIGFPEA